MADEPAAAATKSPTGRIIVGALYAAVLLYGLIAIVGSMVRQVYWAPPVVEGAMTTREQAWCIAQMHRLRDDLEEHVRQEAAAPRREGPPGSAWEKWDAKWLQRLQNVADRCEVSSDESMGLAYTRLRDVHDGYARGIDEIIRTRSSAASRFEAALPKR